MLVLFESAAGFSLFKLLDDGSLDKPDKLYKKYFADAEKTSKIIKLKKFQGFPDVTTALQAATADGELADPLTKFLKKNVVDKKIQDKLIVDNARLGGLIKKELGIECESNSKTNELMRCVRAQLDSLLTSVTPEDARAMQLGLAHSLSRYTLKFSPDKIDTMLVQAISLLDDLDKEINIYAMRVREWYGWHFPELSSIVADNLAYARVVKKMGPRTNALDVDLADILPLDLAEEVQRQAQVSMGTEVSEADIANVQELCDQVLDISEYREELYDYLRNRMQALAPQLTVLVGELVGARLIAHAGSLMSLAKYPASTIQILGAEKALFRALKTKHETPKYGLIYHASLVGQTAPKNKGKISRVLAAKCSLAIRVDALSDEKSVPSTIGQDSRVAVEQRVRMLEGGVAHQLTGSSKGKSGQQSYSNAGAPLAATYNASADSTLVADKQKKEKKEKKKKRKRDDVESTGGDTTDAEEKQKSKKAKKEKKSKKSKDGSEKKKKKKEKK